MMGGCANSPPIVVIEEPNKTTYDRIKDNAKANQVPLELAVALINIESGFKPYKENRGAMGLGQIKCPTAKKLGFDGPCFTLIEQDVNLHYSMMYLRRALDRSHDDWCGAATLYNRGLDHEPKTSAFCQRVLRKIGKKDEKVQIRNNQ